MGATVFEAGIVDSDYYFTSHEVKVVVRVLNRYLDAHQSCKVDTLQEYIIN